MAATSPPSGQRRPGPTPTSARPISSASSGWDEAVDSSFISTTSSTPFFGTAPTPNNTFSPPDVYAGQSISYGYGPHYSSIGEVVTPDGHMQSFSSGPGYTPESITPQPSLSFSSHASSRLLPTPTTSQLGSIPHSNRPIPAPPQSLHTQSHLSSTGGTELVTPTAESIALSSPPIGKTPLDLSAMESRGGAKGQDDRDAARLRQLGYDAVLGRDYTFWSSLSISWLNIGALQGTIYAVSGCYSYGGPLMILIAWPLSGVFCFFLTLTLGEFASAYPVSGAMSSWAWKLARGGVGGERAWAWVLGGFVMGGHVGNILLVTWEIVNIVAGTMAISFDYEKKSWHLFLLFLAVLLIVGTVGGTAWGRSHRFWLISGMFGFSMWLMLCITLLATNATKHKPDSSFTNFYNTTGWSSKPYVYLLGWQFTTIASGADASAHMAEETQNPSRNVPNAMTAAVIGTYLLGYISIILLLLSVTPADAATVKSHTFPFGFILTQAISERGAVAICCLMIVVLHLQVLAQLQASSRFVFALARDNAMPFSDWVRRTNASRNPVIANWAVVALCAPFACMTLGSRSALYSVLAVTACTMSYTGYIVPVGLYLWSGKDLQTEGRSSFSLRRWSKPVAVIGLLYGTLLIIAQTFPGHKPVTAATMSWSPVIIVGTCLLSFVTWKCYGDRHYSGPIRAVTKWETGVEIDLSTALGGAKSRPSGHGLASTQDGHGHTPGRVSETESSLKLALEPHMPSVVHTVTVDSGHTVELTSTGWTDGTSTGEWTSGSATDSGGSGSSDGEQITPTASRR
ncbi:hypothetical protein IAU60_000996 [Kwoniella sp. DSM 27419]